MGRSCEQLSAANRIKDKEVRDGSLQPTLNGGRSLLCRNAKFGKQPHWWSLSVYCGSFSRHRTARMLRGRKRQGAISPWLNLRPCGGSGLSVSRLRPARNSTLLELMRTAANLIRTYSFWREQLRLISL